MHRHIELAHFSHCILNDQYVILVVTMIMLTRSSEKMFNPSRCTGISRINTTSKLKGAMVKVTKNYFLSLTCYPEIENKYRK